MQQHEAVVIRFNEDGPGVEVEAVGVKGRGCTELTRPFEEALGKPSARQLKAEYSQAAVGQSVKVGGVRP